MLRITGIKLNIEGGREELVNAAAKRLRIGSDRIRSLKVVKKSLDARDKKNIHWNYIVDCEVPSEEKVLKDSRSRNVSKAEVKKYRLPERGTAKPATRPYIIGSGPAGLFCAYELAKAGYRPVLIERGEPVERRIETVKKFWESNVLDPSSNIQFGEGGAGTFSDGKLNTGVNDRGGRNRKVLETFTENGAPEEILYINKPHIGTDVLVDVIRNMRNKIISWGGEVRFDTQLTSLEIADGTLTAVTLKHKDEIKKESCSILVPAVGHSARDTFYMLKDKGLDMTAKAFAVGVRAEHRQSDINRAMYGEDYAEIYKDALPAADYKLTYKAASGRGVYSFCMCLGGYVVNASSEEGELCVNGMSYSKRDGVNANSAIVVTVSPEDTGGDTYPMKGVEFQRELERKAYNGAGGFVPSQRLKDFKEGRKTSDFGKITPQIKGAFKGADINEILPEYICRDIKEAFESFGKVIKGFDDPDTVLSAVESRTSCPLRILRDENFESNIKGIFPCGEGAGYAGGIVSSAMDGIKVFEEIYRRFCPL